MKSVLRVNQQNILQAYSTAKQQQSIVHILTINESQCFIHIFITLIKLKECFTQSCYMLQ